METSVFILILSNPFSHSKFSSTFLQKIKHYISRNVMRFFLHLYKSMGRKFVHICGVLSKNTKRGNKTL